MQRRIKCECAQIGGGRLVFVPLYLESMTELQMGVCCIGVHLERLPIGVLGLLNMTRFFKSVAVLNPYRGLIRLPVWHAGRSSSARAAPLPLPALAGHPCPPRRS